MYSVQFLRLNPGATATLPLIATALPPDRRGRAVRAGSGSLVHTGRPATMGRCAGGSLPERAASSYIRASDTPSLAAACEQGVCEQGASRVSAGVSRV